MNIQETENSVDMLLSTFGFKKQEGEEQPLRVLLHHLYTAVAMYKEMDFKDKAIIAKTNKKFRSIFEINFNLKQRKRNNKEKDRVPPTTPLQDKENKKEKDEEICVCASRHVSGNLEERREAFRKECFKYEKKYDSKRILAFFNYFSIANKSGTKMLFEGKRYWDTEKKLELWMDNQYTAATEAAAIRLKKTKQKDTEKAEAVEKQQVVAELREQANQEREAEIERSKAGAVSYEEWKRLRGKI